MYNVEDYRIIYNNTIPPAICKGWHFSHMWKSFAWSRLFTRRGDLVPDNYFNPPTFYRSACSNPGKWAVMYLCVWSIDCASF
jgi:hypothetical protein